MSKTLIDLQATRAMREADLEMAIDLAERRPSLGDAEWIATCNKRVQDAHDAISRHLGLPTDAERSAAAAKRRRELPILADGSAPEPAAWWLQ